MSIRRTSGNAPALPSGLHRRNTRRIETDAVASRQPKDCRGLNPQRSSDSLYLGRAARNSPWLRPVRHSERTTHTPWRGSVNCESSDLVAVGPFIYVALYLDG